MVSKEETILELEKRFSGVSRELTCSRESIESCLRLQCSVFTEDSFAIDWKEVSQEKTCLMIENESMWSGGEAYALFKSRQRLLLIWVCFGERDLVRDRLEEGSARL